MAMASISIAERVDLLSVVKYSNGKVTTHRAEYSFGWKVNENGEVKEVPGKLNYTLVAN